MRVSTYREKKAVNMPWHRKRGAADTLLSQPLTNHVPLNVLNLNYGFLKILASHDPMNVLNIKDELLNIGLRATLLGDIRIDLPRVNFSGLHLRSCKIIVPRLKDADFTGADLRNASIVGCHITKEVFNFEGAEITDLRGCADLELYNSLTPDQRATSHLLFIPKEEYFFQFKLVNKYPDEIDSFGACHGLAREFVRQAMKSKESGKEFRFFQKLNAALDASSPSKFVKRIGYYLATSYLDLNYPHLRVRNLREIMESTIFYSDYINIVVIGEIDDKPLNHSIVFERIGRDYFKVYDTNYGRTMLLETIHDLIRVMDALTIKYCAFRNAFYVTDIGKEVRERNLLEYKNAYEDLSKSENLERFGLMTIC